MKLLLLVTMFMSPVAFASGSEIQSGELTRLILPQVPMPVAPGGFIPAPLFLVETCYDPQGTCNAVDPGIPCGGINVCIAGTEKYRWQTTMAEMVVYNCFCEDKSKPLPLPFDESLPEGDGVSESDDDRMQSILEPNYPSSLLESGSSLVEENSDDEQMIYSIPMLIP